MILVGIVTENNLRYDENREKVGVELVIKFNGFLIFCSSLSLIKEDTSVLSATYTYIHVLGLDQIDLTRCHFLAF